MCIFFVLQILSALDILIPLPVMLEMFQTGVRSLSEVQKQPAPPKIQTPPPVPSSLPLGDFPPGSPLSPEASTMFIFPKTEEPEDESSYSNINCFIMMLDLVIKQVRAYF